MQNQVLYYFVFCMVLSFTTVLVTNHEGYLILQVVLYFINSLYLCKGDGKWACICAIAHKGRLDAHLRELAFPLHHLGLRDQTQATRLG